MGRNTELTERDVCVDTVQDGTMPASGGTSPGFSPTAAQLDAGAQNEPADVPAFHRKHRVRSDKALVELWPGDIQVCCNVSGEMSELFC